MTIILTLGTEASGTNFKCIATNGDEMMGGGYCPKQSKRLLLSKLNNYGRNSEKYSLHDGVCYQFLEETSFAEVLIQGVTV